MMNKYNKLKDAPGLAFYLGSILIPALITMTLLFSCGHKNQQADKPVTPMVLPPASHAIEQTIQKEFPDAMMSEQFRDSLAHFLAKKYNITTDKVLIGASTCVDDIIYTKNFHSHPEIKGPFHLGGLAGLPFTGISGLEALAHHIPEGGTMVLLVEPHIGYSSKKGWGYILRHEQHELTTCCGALMGALVKLQDGTLRPGIRDEDYQGSKIAELAFAHETEILSAERPILALTRLTSKEALRQIRLHVAEISFEHIQYIVIISGVLINTDYRYSDYQFVDHFMVYDVKKKRFVEDRSSPFVIE